MTGLQGGTACAQAILARIAGPSMFVNVRVLVAKSFLPVLLHLLTLAAVFLRILTNAQ
jgi:hypothetical protein